MYLDSKCVPDVNSIDYITRTWENRCFHPNTNSTKYIVDLDLLDCVS
jgi:hypothetical protein